MPVPRCSPAGKVGNVAEDPFEAAVTAAIAADIARMRDLPRGAKPLVWQSPSRDQVAALIRPWFDRAVAAEAKVEELRNTAANFLAHYGDNPSASFKVAGDLAHGMLQVADKEPLP